MSEEMKPCRFCGAGEFHFDESKHWTGQSSMLLKFRLYHWCQHAASRIYIEEKTKDACIAKWNETFGKS